jgi:hypothetical protein
MNRNMLVLVAVVSGLVEVNVNGVPCTLAGGQSRAFAEEGRARGDGEGRDGRGGHAQNPDVLGMIAHATPDELTLAMRGENIAIVKVNSDTKVAIEGNEVETVAGEGGRETRRVKTTDGTAADLKVGVRVRCVLNTDTKVATQVVIRAATPEGGRDGRRTADANPSSRREAAARDGATRDGATRDGATRDGATRDGATRDGATRDGATRDANPRVPAEGDRRPGDANAGNAEARSRLEAAQRDADAARQRAEAAVRAADTRPQSGTRDGDAPKPAEGRERTGDNVRNFDPDAAQRR